MHMYAAGSPRIVQTQLLYLQRTCSSRSKTTSNSWTSNSSVGRGLRNGTNGLLVAGECKPSAPPGRASTPLVQHCSSHSLLAFSANCTPEYSPAAQPMRFPESQPAALQALLLEVHRRSGLHKTNLEGVEQRINLRCDLMQGKCKVWPPPQRNTTSPSVQHEAAKK